MRAIKFRGWNKKEKKMYQMEIFSVNNPGVEFLQFTGLIDKTGKEIYEGDIVTSTHADIVPSYTWTVSWKDAGFYPFNDADEQGHGELRWYGVREHLETFEIIGNIYENPELLRD